MGQTPLDQAYLISMWLEAVVYGFLFCLFFGSLYINITLRRHQDSHSRIMFYIGIIMFVIATVHLGVSCYRLVQGYVVHGSDPGGAVSWLGALPPWHHVIKDTLYANQEIMGDAVAVYRTWVIWNRNWKAVVVPCFLIIGGMVTGYATVGLYPTEKAGVSIFDPRLLRWITSFYAVSFTQSFLTTSLMAYRIWQADRRSAKFRTTEGNLMPVLRILVESAALQLVVEFVLLVLYAMNENAQYILLELVTPLVAITFNAITIRIALRSSEALSFTHSSQQHTPEAQVATIGSIPMRPIAINIRKDVEAHNDGRSENDDFGDSEIKR